jgi:hypothetical protein
MARIQCLARSKEMREEEDTCVCVAHPMLGALQRDAPVSILESDFIIVIFW